MGTQATKPVIRMEGTEFLPSGTVTTLDVLFPRVGGRPITDGSYAIYLFPAASGTVGITATPLDQHNNPVANDSVSVVSGLSVVAKTPETDGAYQLNFDYDYKVYGWRLTFTGSIAYNKIMILH